MLGPRGRAPVSSYLPGTGPASLPITRALKIFVASHYAGEDLLLKFKPGEIWKKVFGPVFIYLNSVEDRDDALSLWTDPKEQMEKQVQSWPYSFAASDDFPNSDQRGIVRGKMLVHDRYVCEDPFVVEAAYVGLAPPGDTGSWQRESKGYQFWTTVDENGCFTINNIRTGDYNLFAYVPGFIGDYKSELTLTITQGSKFLRLNAHLRTTSHLCFSS